MLLMPLWLEHHASYHTDATVRCERCCPGVRHLVPDAWRAVVVRTGGRAMLAVHMVLAARMVVGARNLSALQNNDVIFKI